MRTTYIYRNSKKTWNKSQNLSNFWTSWKSDNIVENTVKFIEKVKQTMLLYQVLIQCLVLFFYNHPEKYGIKSIDKDLRKHAHLLYRFGSEDDELGLPFEYHEETLLAEKKELKY